MYYTRAQSRKDSQDSSRTLRPRTTKPQTSVSNTKKTGRVDKRSTTTKSAAKRSTKAGKTGRAVRAHPVEISDPAEEEQDADEQQDEDEDPEFFLPAAEESEDEDVSMVDLGSDASANAGPSRRTDTTATTASTTIPGSNSRRGWTFPQKNKLSTRPLGRAFKLWLPVPHGDELCQLRYNIERPDLTRNSRALIPDSWEAMYKHYVENYEIDLRTTAVETDYALLMQVLGAMGKFTRPYTRKYCDRCVARGCNSQCFSNGIDACLKCVKAGMPCTHTDRKTLKTTFLNGTINANHKLARRSDPDAQWVVVDYRNLPPMPVGSWSLYLEDHTRGYRRQSPALDPPYPFQVLAPGQTPSFVQPPPKRVSRPNLAQPMKPFPYVFAVPPAPGLIHAEYLYPVPVPEDGEPVMTPAEAHASWPAPGPLITSDWRAVQQQTVTNNGGDIQQQPITDNYGGVPQQSFTNIGGGSTAEQNPIGLSNTFDAPGGYDYDFSWQGQGQGQPSGTFQLGSGLEEPSLVQPPEPATRAQNLGDNTGYPMMPNDRLASIERNQHAFMQWAAHQNQITRKILDQNRRHKAERDHLWKAAIELQGIVRTMGYHGRLKFDVTQFSPQLQDRHSPPIHVRDLATFLGPKELGVRAPTGGGMNQTSNGRIDQLPSTNSNDSGLIGLGISTSNDQGNTSGQAQLQISNTPTNSGTTEVGQRSQPEALTTRPATNKPNTGTGVSKPNPNGTDNGQSNRSRRVPESAQAGPMAGRQNAGMLNRGQAAPSRQMPGDTPPPRLGDLADYYDPTTGRGRPVESDTPRGRDPARPPPPRSEALLGFGESMTTLAPAPAPDSLDVFNPTSELDQNQNDPFAGLEPEDRQLIEALGQPQGDMAQPPWISPNHPIDYNFFSPSGRPRNQGEAQNAGNTGNQQPFLQSGGTGLTPPSQYMWGAYSDNQAFPNGNPTENQSAQRQSPNNELLFNDYTTLGDGQGGRGDDMMDMS